LLVSRAQGPPGPIFCIFGAPDAPSWRGDLLKTGTLSDAPSTFRETTAAAATAVQHNLLFVGGQQLIRANGTMRSLQIFARSPLSLYNMVGGGG